MTNSTIHSILNVFRDHYKRSSDWFRDILGLYFDIKDNKIIPNIHKLQEGALWTFSSPTVIDGNISLYKQTVKFQPKDNQENRQMLQALFNPSSDPAEQDFFLGTKDQIIKKTLSNSNKKYRDINTKTVKAALFTTNISEASLFVDINAKYNFFIPKYEDKIKLDIVPEEVLPNFYVVSLALDRSILDGIKQEDYNSEQLLGIDSPYDNFLQKFDNFITLDNNLILNPNGELSGNWLAGLVLVAYCEKYAESYDNVGINFIETMKKRFGNLVTDITNQELMNKLNQFKDSYPMYIELLFKVSRNNKFLTFLEDSKLSLDALSSFINEKVIIETQANTNTELPGNIIVFSLTEPFQIVEDKQNNNLLNENKQFLYIHDAESFVREYISNIQNDSTSIQEQINQNSGNSTILNLSNIPSMNNDQENIESILQNLAILTAESRFNDLLKNSFRSYEQIKNGELAYSEILYFRIEKSDKNSRVIQNFYLPNIPDVDIQNFVDTQVKYNKEYQYKIFANTIIYGTEYYYEADYSNSGSPVLLPPDNEVVITPTYGLQQQEGESGGLVVDAVPEGYPGAESPVIKEQTKKISIPVTPPINSASPNTFVPQSINATSFSVPNQSGIDNVLAPPTQINQGFLEGYEFDVYYQPSVFLVEIEYSDIIKTSVVDFPSTPPIAEFFPIKDCDKKFMLKLSPSVGVIKDFPVYIDSNDNDYFQQLLIQQKSTDNKITFKYEGDAVQYEVLRLENEPTAYTDFAKSHRTLYNQGENILITQYVEPNKDYFYTFRILDVHNGRSNPSPIYKVKLFSNDGVEYLDVQIYSFKEPIKTFTKSFKKYLRINPGLLQTTFSVLDNKLGLVDESAFNQKFLLRIKSKHTGKIIDMMINYRLEDKI